MRCRYCDTSKPHDAGEFCGGCGAAWDPEFYERQKRANHPPRLSGTSFEDVASLSCQHAYHNGRFCLDCRQPLPRLQSAEAASLTSMAPLFAELERQVRVLRPVPELAAAVRACRCEAEAACPAPHDDIECRECGWEPGHCLDCHEDGYAHTETCPVPVDHDGSRWSQDANGWWVAR